MRLKEFVSTYNLYELDIIKYEYVNNNINLYISFEIEASFIANGCRPEFDYEVCHLFSFLNQDKQEIKGSLKINDYHYENNELIIKFENEDLLIKDSNILITPNIILK